MKQENLIREKSFAFAVRIIRLNQYLLKRNEFVISRQILRAGTSIGANIEEAQGGVTTKEFLQRVTTAYREARETLYWLKLMKTCQIVKPELIGSLVVDCEELVRLLSAAQRTLKAKTAAH
jgi:four helix bundle protein